MVGLNYPNKQKPGTVYTDASKDTTSNETGIGIYFKDFEISLTHLPLTIKNTIIKKTSHISL